MNSVQEGISVLFTSLCPELRTQSLLQGRNAMHTGEWFLCLTISVLSTWHSARNLELPNKCSVSEQMLL